MNSVIQQTLFMYALAIIISMGVAYMIKGLNKLLFIFEDAQKRREEANSNGKAA